ncbi:MAG: ATP-binding protein [Bacteroidetes bacterium]|nr:ATP-binding protein [Bacteroidota bacterium]
MSLLLGYEILESYKRLSYKDWFAFAEFIDNSTQSLRNHKQELTSILEDEGKILTVDIDYNNSKTDGFIKITDNAFGMDENELMRALILGKRPVNDKERSKYGLGMKTAAFWFGDAWEIKTTQFGNDKIFSIRIDLDEILQQEKKYYESIKNGEQQLEQFKPKLNFVSTDCDVKEHGTTIIISKLNRTITPAKANKCQEYLRSIYRVDLVRNNLDLIFKGEHLTWDQNAIFKKLLHDSEDKPYYRNLSFIINGKKVNGWAGVLKKGGRQIAGFSLLQADRVIQGWPNNYKNSTLFGDQEGGINNLVNQRLFGELNLDGFEVSHTKDEILFTDNEEAELDNQLLSELGDYKKIAEDYRARKEVGFDFELAVNQILASINQPEIKKTIFQKEVLPKEILEKTDTETITRLLKSESKTFKALIGDLEITVVLSEDSSPYDPYLIVQARSERNKLTILINKNHSYWDELDDKNSEYNFLLNCIFDGISEWKANFIAESIDPDTIKHIKDHFLRIKLTVL